MRDEFIWVEKYRPKKIKDCILTEELKNTFTQFLKQKEIPNLLLRCLLHLKMLLQLK